MAQKARRRSRWMLRALEWNDPRARYPNLWVDGMPVQILAFDTVAMRLHLGDLIAVFHPGPKSGARKKGVFVGLSRVAGLRKSFLPDQYWIDLETAHKLKKPLAPARVPRRVFLCCDPEWPGPDVELFGELFAAAVAEGWKPGPGEGEEPGQRAVAEAMEPTEPMQAKPRVEGEAAVEPESPGEPEAPTSAENGTPESGSSDGSSVLNEMEASMEPAAAEAPVEEPEPAGRLFAGVELGPGLRDERNDTWMAVVQLVGEENPGLELVRLEPCGRAGMSRHLKSPDSVLARVEGFGIGFPFALPESFVKAIHDGDYPSDGWWGLVRFMEKTRYPEYLMKIQEFCKEQEEPVRYTDEKAGSGSPLKRSRPDLGSAAYHGIRMLAEERSRYTVRPFESAKGRYLFEVRPPLKEVSLDEETIRDRNRWKREIQDRLGGLPALPVRLDDRFRELCGTSGAALKAVLAARQAAAAILSGEVEKSPEELDEEQAERIAREGWIYGGGA